MNLKSLVVVILRLLALNFFIDVALRLAPQILRVTNLYQNASPADLDVILAMPWLIVTGLIGGAIVLWVFALPIARLVTSDLPPELSLGALSLADCYSIAFMGVGLSYVASHFAGVLNWAHYLLKTVVSHEGNSWREKVNWYEVMQAIVPFIIGVILFVNGRRWAIALARRETAPPSPERDSN